MLDNKFNDKICNHKILQTEVTLLLKSHYLNLIFLKAVF